MQSKWIMHTSQWTSLLRAYNHVRKRIFVDSNMKSRNYDSDNKQSKHICKWAWAISKGKDFQFSLNVSNFWRRFLTLIETWLIFRIFGPYQWVCEIIIIMKLKSFGNVESLGSTMSLFEKKRSCLFIDRLQLILTLFRLA